MTAVQLPLVWEVPFESSCGFLVLKHGGGLSVGPSVQYNSPFLLNPTAQPVNDSVNNEIQIVAMMPLGFDDKKFIMAFLLNGPIILALAAFFEPKVSDDYHQLTESWLNAFSDLLIRQRD